MTKSDPIAAGLRLFALVALAGAAACGGAPEPEAVLATVRSWTTTMALASADVDRGAISTRLALQLRDRAMVARRELASALAKGVRSPGEATRGRAVLDSLDAAIGELAPATAGR